MRNMLWFVVLAASIGSADVVTRTSGGTVQGRVVQVVVQTAAGQRVTVRDVASVHLDADRELLDLRSLASNFRFARAFPGKAKGGVAVYMGTGVFAPSAQAVVRRLVARGLVPQLLFDGELDLRGTRLLVVPGGWAPSILASMGETGQASVRTFVKGGGAYLGICAGGYVPCEGVEWNGAKLTYPLKLVRGHAKGTVPDLVAWPRSQTVELSTGRALYAGGAYYEVKGARVLARYPGGQAAAIEVEYGKGKLLLTGAHVEFDKARDRDLLTWAPGVDPGDARLLKAFVDRLLK